MTITYVDVLRQAVAKQDVEKIPYRPAALLGLLAKQTQLQTSIEWDVNIGGAVPGGRAVTADVAVADDASETMRKAVLPIANHLISHKFSVRPDEIINTRNAYGGPGVKNLFQQHIDTAYEMILQRANVLCYTGTGSAADRGMIGLNATATAGYAGLTATDWIAYRQANGGTPIAMTRSMFEKIDVNVRRKMGTYTAIVTTPEMVKRYQALFATDRTYQARGLTPGGLPKADIGYSGASYNNVEIYEDNDCPAGTMYFLDLRKIKFLTFASRDIVGLDNRRTLATINAPQTFGLDFQIAQITNRNPDLLEFEIGIKPQLWIQQPKFVSIVTDVIQTV